MQGPRSRSAGGCRPRLSAPSPKHPHGQARAHETDLTGRGHHGRSQGARAGRQVTWATPPHGRPPMGSLRWEGVWLGGGHGVKPWPLILQASCSKANLAGEGPQGLFDPKEDEEGEVRRG